MVNGSDDGRMLLVLERKAFSGAAIVTLVEGSMLTFGAVFLFIGIFLEDSFPITVVLLGLIFGFIGVVWAAIGLDRAKHSTIEISTSSIRHSEKGRLVEEITWSPTVRVDVRTNNGRRNDTHGPLAGYKFYEEGKSFIEIDPKDGWPMGSIRRAWDPVIGIVKEKHLKMGEELVEYLERRSKDGLDRDGS